MTHPGIPLYRTIAETLDTLGRIAIRDDIRQPWQTVWQETLDSAVSNGLPHGSGFDVYPALDRDKSTPEKLVFFGSYHGMDENGSYERWYDYGITLKASLTSGFNLTITGGGKHREYIAETFHEALSRTYGPNHFRPAYSLRPYAEWKESV